MKKHTTTAGPLPAHSVSRLPAARTAQAATAPDQVTAPPGEPRAVFRFALPTKERAHDREDFAAVL
ncbi:hypothetical protein OTB20_36395 [Streptomyces sp. H27-H1]|uniref:hypothetical protein n=1 Tax=Streptomyces sp. H27-H1 TaxID=2996461 RepID=UPI002271355B|nr:hypothetical protein [Streptomyces sp. H27-H1]MCY0931573.1 hypothetical protein [Streptomyces sp. H27-H1]